MIAELLLHWLIGSTIATSIALLLVLALRRSLRRTFGGRMAYAAWGALPLALLASFLPAPQLLFDAVPILRSGIWVDPALPLATSADIRAMVNWNVILLLVWLAGAAVLAARFVLRQRRFLVDLGPLRDCGNGIYVADAASGPLVVGMLWPRIVLPADFATRYPPSQAALVIAHERAHVDRGDVSASLAFAILRCLYWFNPLLHAAVTYFRLDQELACDAAVLARHPKARRAYADAMLNTQLTVPGLPVGCHWQSSQSLKERIVMLKHPLPGAMRNRLGAITVCLVLAGSSFGAWALQPAARTGQVETSALSQGVQGGLMPPPKYPAEAAKNKQSGRVILKLQVAPDGNVKDVVVEQSEPAGVFDAVSVEAAHNWRFTPRMEDGRAVESWVRVPVDFDPDDPPGETARD